MATPMIALSDIQFASPLWLWLWPLTTLILGLLLKHGYLLDPGEIQQRRVQARYRHPQIALLRQLYGQVASRRPGLTGWQWLGYSLVALGLHGALAQPYKLGARLPDPPGYRDTVFIIDSSVSMVLKDYVIGERRVDRMTMMKHVMSHFVRGLKDNRIGIVSFSENAYTLVPLTDDYSVLLAQIKRLRPAALTGRTSRPGQALLYTSQSLTEQLNEEAPRPTLVLISDVNRPDRQVDPRVAAEFLATQGYHLHVIGIGGASYAAGDDEQRGLIYHPSNFALLQAIAERGNGQFYWAKNTRTLQDTIRAIQDREKHTVNAAPRYVPVTLYQWPLLFALICLALISLPGRSRRKQ
jgi:Ca-activated chloride channel family protein